MQFLQILTLESKEPLISHRPFYHNLLVELFYSKKTLTLTKKIKKLKKVVLLVLKGEHNAYELY